MELAGMEMRRRIRISSVAGISIALIACSLSISCNRGATGGEIPRPDHLESLSAPVREQITEALEKATKDPSAENLGHLGMVYHSSANYEEAARCYRMADQKSRSEWIWEYYQGILFLEMGNSQEVIECFRRVLEENPQANLAWYYMGQEYRNLRNYQLSEEAYQHISTPGTNTGPIQGSTREDHFPLHTYARFELARIYNETGRDELAERTLREILQGTRTFGPAYRLLGNIYYARGDSILGNRYGVRANDLMVFIPPVDTLVDQLVLLSRSELYLLKKIDEAERTYYDQWTVRLVEQGLTYMPENKYLISKAINIFLWVGMHDRASALTEKNITYFRDDYGELNRIGLAFFVNRIYGEAKKYLERALELRPDEILVQEELAMCQWSLGKNESALALLDDLYRKHPDDPDVLADLADIQFFNFGETDLAMSMLNRLKQIDPDHPKGLKVAAGL
ncbi:MAG: tetratricopeptide repeat protein, partial [Bacteroidales bacterium]